MAAEATPALLYVPDLPGPGTRLSLSAEDAHYVARVCRARAGEHIQATDGRGALVDLALVEVRGRVVVEVVSVVRREAARRAWVLCGVPEGERADWLVEKLAELGVERFVPVDGVRARWRRAAGRRARWERLARAALKQSRRLHLLSVGDPVSVASALDGLPEGSSRWLAEASGGELPAESGRGPGLAVGLVGPSAGFADREREEILGAGFRALRLSDARLRTETAALAWAAWWARGVE